MADKSDKVFDPTPGRIKKARDEGNVFKSQEASSAALLLTGITVIGFGMPYAWEGMKQMASEVFMAAAITPVNIAVMPSVIATLGFRTMWIIAPMFGAMMVTAFGIQLLQSGWNFTLKPLEPKPERISPIKGFQRIFSSKGLFNTAKALIKIAVVGPMAYLFIKNHIEELLMLQTLDIQVIMSLAGDWIILLAYQLLVALILLSAVDWAFEKWKYKEDLKMSKQEVKDESRESEGDPQVARKRRQLQREMSMRPRLDHAVLKADVVITNPTHYAVALRYDASESPAPQVLVKGIRRRALRIKELAREHDIPTVEDRPLARALYHNVPEMTEIPADLYPAVAAILAEIYRTQGRAA